MQRTIKSDCNPALHRSTRVELKTATSAEKCLVSVAKHTAGAIRTALLALLLCMTLPVAAQDTQAPSVPTGLVATAFSSGEVKLTWNASNDNDSVKGYYVYLNNVPLGTTKGTWFYHCGLTANTTYNYRVSAYDSVPNHSAWTSTPVSVTTLSSPAPSSLNFCATFNYATGPFTPTGDSGTSNDGMWWVEQKNSHGYTRTTIVPVGREGGSGLRLHTDVGDSEVSNSGVLERNDVAQSATTGGGGPGTDATEGKEQWWAHSMLFPDDFAFPPYGGWVAVAGFHHTDLPPPDPQGGQGNVSIFAGTDSVGTCDATVGNHLYLRGHGGLNPVQSACGDANGYTYGADLGTVVNNLWYDIVYHVKWSSGSDGYMQVWVNGELKLNLQNIPTLYARRTAFLKLENYHNAYGSAVSVNHDRVMRGTTWDAVALSELEGLVSITSPMAGSTISGNITVTATAYTSFNVVGVQFMYDGINPFGLGEDTTVPYSANADTTLVSNGWHTLTAISRDSAGNHITSAPVTVYVSN
jgi:chitodextrinase